MRGRDRVRVRVRERYGGRTLNGHLADTWRTLNGHLADTWRTVSGHLTDIVAGRLVATAVVVLVYMVWNNDEITPVFALP
jgi:hypothetical protein